MEGRRLIVHPLASPAGAVSARLFVHDSPLCLVNAHLSSGSKEGDEVQRNSDVLDILRRCDYAAQASWGVGWGGEREGKGEGKER